MRTTSVSGASVFTARRSSSPLIPGIMRSVTTTDARSRRRTSSAAGPLLASATRQPSRSKIFPSDSRFEVSSSTMRTSGGTERGYDAARRGGYRCAGPVPLGALRPAQGRGNGGASLRLGSAARHLGRHRLGLGLGLPGLGALRGAVLLSRLRLLACGGGSGRGRRGLDLRLRGSGSVPRPELLDATRRVEDLLLAREEGVAARADLDVEVAARRAGLDDGPAVADDLGGLVLGVDRFLHGVLSAACTGRSGHRGGPGRAVGIAGSSRTAGIRQGASLS